MFLYLETEISSVELNLFGYHPVQVRILNGMATIRPQLHPPPSLDEDYDYNTGAESPTRQTARTTMSTTRPRKGLGAMPVEAQEPRAVSPRRQHGVDPPAQEPGVVDDKPQNEDELLDLEQLEELHDEAERMKALGNKHMAAQVRSHLGFV